MIKHYSKHVQCPSICLCKIMSHGAAIPVASVHISVLAVVFVLTLCFNTIKYTANPLDRCL